MPDMRIGFDVGGCIIRAVEDGADTSFFSDNYLDTPACDGAIETIAEFVELLGPDNVFIISKCGDEVQAKTMAWMHHNRFFGLTGMSRDNVHFCLKRLDKTPIAKRLGLTHFLDDRLDVLNYMLGTVPHRLHFHPPHGLICTHEITGIRRVESWAQLSSWLNYTGG